jgi:integrase
MGRPGKPWWHTRRRRWCANIDGVRYVEPTGLGKRQVHEAWEWHRSIIPAPRPLGAPGTLEDLCEAYLSWDSERVEAGERDGRAHQTTGYKLNRICGTRASVGLAGDVPVGRITPGLLEDLVTAWGRDGLSDAYRRELASAVKAVTRWASRSRGGSRSLLASDPLERTSLPRAVAAPAERYAGRDEAAAWLRWLWRRGLREPALLQRCLVHTGARPSELVRATWGDVKLESGTITLSRWKAARKTGRPRRVYLPSRLIRSLRRRAGQPDGLIWRTPRGLAWSGSNLATYTARLRAAAIADGIPVLADGPDRLVNYRWRHTAATSLLQDGVPIATVAELLGTSPAMIARTYAHILSDHLSAAAETLARRRR